MKHRSTLLNPADTDVAAWSTRPGFSWGSISEGSDVPDPTQPPVPQQVRARRRLPQQLFFMTEAAATVDVDVNA